MERAAAAAECTDAHADAGDSSAEATATAAFASPFLLYLLCSHANGGTGGDGGTRESGATFFTGPPPWCGVVVVVVPSTVISTKIRQRPAIVPIRDAAAAGVFAYCAAIFLACKHQPTGSGRRSVPVHRGRDFSVPGLGQPGRMCEEVRPVDRRDR